MIKRSFVLGTWLQVNIVNKSYLAEKSRNFNGLCYVFTGSVALLTHKCQELQIEFTQDFVLFIIEKSLMRF